jgi:uncharacterized membrane protein (UPF0127 family)
VSPANPTRSPVRSDWPARALAILTLSSILLFTNGCRFGEPDEPEPDAWLEIRGQRVSIEIADTPEKQRKGLGERDALDWDHGMYFEYSQSGFYAFWMKGMRFSIDILWLRDGRIVGIEANVPFEKGGNGPTVRPRELTDAVLEVPAGYSSAAGWMIGDRVHLERIKAN